MTDEQDDIKAKAENSLNEILGGDLATLLMNDMAAGFSDPKRRQFAERSFLYSKANLKVSKMLYPEYKALSIYHLQQSVEHFSKAYSYLLLGIDETKKFRHNNFLVLCALTDYFSKNPAGKLFLPAMDRLDKFKAEKPEDIAMISEADMNTFIEVMDNLTAQCKSVLNTALSEEKLRALVDSIVEVQKDREKRAALRFKGMDIARKTVSQGGVELFHALILGWLTYPHEAYTQYPDGIITPDDYDNGRVGIVKAYDKIYGVVEIAINTSFNYLIQK